MISFVIPVYCEEETLPLLRARMTALLDGLSDDAEVVLVNDGSRDRSLALMNEMGAADPRFRVVDLSRNYGHQVAVTAGLNAARGDAVITMDADLQDPPEVAIEMIEKWREGAQVVLAKRVARAGESFFKRATAAAFYRIIRRLSSTEMPLDVGDFRLLDRQVVDALAAMPEQDRYLRGMIGWVGYRQAEVRFNRDERVAGVTKYPLRAMLRLAANGVLGFSDVPLRLALWVGMTISAAALAFGGYIFLSWFFTDTVVEGWTSTVLILTFLGGIQLLMMGIVGLYIGRIHNEVKRRPLYFVNEPASPAGHQGMNSALGGSSLGGGGADQSKRATPSVE